VSVDSWLEVCDVLRRNKLRTGLTALSVAWGIFMLVILVAAGNGMREGTEYGMRDNATNAVWVRQGKTSLTYGGNGPGRQINFDQGDIDALERELPGIDHSSGRFYMWGAFTVSRGDKTASFDIRGCHPGHQFLEQTLLLAGRFINDIDVAQRRKVAVIGTAVRSALFGASDPIGERISIRGMNYVVVGLFEDQGGQGELRRIYVPITTAQLVYNGGDRVHQIMYTTGAASLAESEAMTDKTRLLLAQRHRYDPEDRRAVQISNNLVQFQKMLDIFDWIQTFVWLVSLGTLFAGVVGVSNIMLISVQERTLEIGIRKAIGATPGSIVAMILSEALLLTSCAGYAGLTSAVALVEFVRRHLPPNDYVRNPSVDVRVALLATLFLVLAGAVAGLLPAVKAARVRPIVAMRGATP
jgi:putative ABC transport system permease protein